MQTIKQYLLENYELEELKDCAEHGCSGGFGQFIYYKDTCAFHDIFENEVWDLIYQQFKDFGHKHVLEFIATWNGAKDVGSMEQFKNLLCWYAVEHFAQEIESEMGKDSEGNLVYDGEGGMSTIKIQLKE